MKNHRFIYWAPRVLAILFIAFLALFSLDVFDGTSGFWSIFLGLLIHNLPTLLLILVLVIAWRYELFGGIVFILAALGYALMIVWGESAWYQEILWGLPIIVPALAVGILFILCWNTRRKVTAGHNER